jgi:hypothetical protein
MLFPEKADNSLIVKPLYYSEEEIEGIYQIFKDEEKRQSKTNPFTALFEEKGYE